MPTWSQKWVWHTYPKQLSTASFSRPWWATWWALHTWVSWSALFPCLHDAAVYRSTELVASHPPTWLLDEQFTCHNSIISSHSGAIFTTTFCVMHLIFGFHLQEKLYQDTTNSVAAVLYLQLRLHTQKRNCPLCKQSGVLELPT